MNNASLIGALNQQREGSHRTYQEVLTDTLALIESMRDQLQDVHASVWGSSVTEEARSLPDEIGERRCQVSDLKFSVPIRSDAGYVLTIRPLDAAVHGLVRIESTRCPDRSVYLHRLGPGQWRVSANSNRNDAALQNSPLFTRDEFNQIVNELLC